VLQHPANQDVLAGVPTTNELGPIEEFDAPDDLSAEERQVWLKQAPHAFKARTLVRSTALAFERYCKLVILERNEAKSSGVGAANHRGLVKLVNDLERQFLLTAIGAVVTELAAAPPAAVHAGASAAGKLARFRS
jgi:hypothetical protein